MNYTLCPRLKHGIELTLENYCAPQFAPLPEAGAMPSD